MLIFIRMLRLLLPLLFVSFFCPNGFALDHGPIIFSHEFSPISPNRIHFSSSIDAFLSKANYDANGGSYEDLRNGGEYLITTGHLWGSYDFNSSFRLNSNLSFAYASSKDDSFSRTATELTEVEAGLSFVPIYRLKTQLFLDLSGGLALNDFSENTDQVLTGEGAHYIKAGVKFTKLFSPLEFYSTLHTLWLSNGRSLRLPWRVGSLFHFASIKFNASLFGFQSIMDDDQTKTPTKKTVVTDRVNAGSLRFYSINPSLIDSQLGIIWQPYHDLQFEVGGTKTLNGENTAEGFGAYLAFHLYWGGDDDSEVLPRKKRQREILRKKPKPSERFKTKEELYDESLFQQKRPKQKRQRPVDVDDAIDDTINQFDK